MKNTALMLSTVTLAWKYVKSLEREVRYQIHQAEESQEVNVASNIAGIFRQRVKYAARSGLGNQSGERSVFRRTYTRAGLQRH